MRKTLVAVALGALMLAPSFTPSAAAAGYSGGDWVFGAGFRVGDFHFSIGYASPRYGHSPDYYYRSSPQLAYRGHRCSDRCFRHERYAYHHRDCPLVRHHFSRYRVEPTRVLARWAPDYRYYSDRGRSGRQDRRSYHHDYDDRGHGRDRYDDRRHGRDRYDDRRGRSRDRDYDDRHRHRGRRGHDHRSHRGGSCPYGR